MLVFSRIATAVTEMAGCSIRIGLVTTITLAGSVCGALPDVAHAATFTTIYSFCAASPCLDGAQPMAGLAIDSTGALYGTTAFGGSSNDGTVFSLTPDTSGLSWNESVLHSFSGRPDGLQPDASLTISGGKLFGTTLGGGNATGEGTVFALTPSSGPAAWQESVLAKFGKPGVGSTNGAFPQYNSVAVGVSGNLYGMTNYGGSANAGVAYKIVPRAVGAATLTLIHSFCHSGGVCSDGSRPESGFVMDPSGNLYGATTQGGKKGGGIVFRLTPPSASARTGWTETVIYDFCRKANCSDGSGPFGRLLLDGSGNLYGTTSGGGKNGTGTVFELAPTVGGGRWTESVLHHFGPTTDSADGATPWSGLAMDETGNIFGTTLEGGGPSHAGTVFKLTQVAHAGPWTETVLHAFTGSPDGATPLGTVIIDSTGNVFGTTIAGGLGVGVAGYNGGGTVWEITP